MIARTRNSFNSVLAKLHDCVNASKCKKRWHFMAYILKTRHPYIPLCMCIFFWNVWLSSCLVFCDGLLYWGMFSGIQVLLSFLHRLVSAADEMHLLEDNLTFNTTVVHTIFLWFHWEQDVISGSDVLTIYS